MARARGHPEGKRPGSTAVPALLLLGVLPFWASNLVLAASSTPNFVLIVADDLGYGDLGCYGNTKIRTPALDRLAAEGVRLTEFYTPAPTCSPARAALLTGRHPLRTGVTRVFIPKEKWGLPHAEITLAEHLKEAGYATACIGKWHLGGRRPFRPHRHGFDSFFGVLYSNNMVWLHRLQFPRFELLDADRVVESPARAGLLTRRYTNRAVQFLEQNRDNSFFLYLAYTMPHLPLAVSDAFASRSPHGLYGDVLRELDASVGHLLARLSELGLDERTYVFFTSDNGPWLGDDSTPGGSSGGLRGFKGTTWEGGLRVPFLARAPGRLPAGEVLSGPATLLDLFPTIGALAGAPLPAGRPYDGLDILPLLQGHGTTESRDLFFSDGRNVHAVRSGAWKLHLYAHTLGPDGRPRKPRALDPPQLYRLDTDPAETNDIAAAHPEVVERLVRSADRFQGGLEPTMKLPSYFWSIVQGLFTQAPNDPATVPR